MDLSPSGYGARRFDAAANDAADTWISGPILTLNGLSASDILAAFRSGSGYESPAGSMPLIVRVFLHQVRLELGADLRGAIDAHANQADTARRDVRDRGNTDVLRRTMRFDGLLGHLQMYGPAQRRTAGFAAALVWVKENRVIRHSCWASGSATSRSRASCREGSRYRAGSTSLERKRTPTLTISAQPTYVSLAIGRKLRVFQVLCGSSFLLFASSGTGKPIGGDPK